METPGTDCELSSRAFIIIKYSLYLINCNSIIVISTYQLSLDISIIVINSINPARVTGTREGSLYVHCSMLISRVDPKLRISADWNCSVHPLLLHMYKKLRIYSHVDANPCLHRSFFKEGKI